MRFYSSNGIHQDFTMSVILNCAFLVISLLKGDLKRHVKEAVRLRQCSHYTTASGEDKLAVWRHEVS